MRLSRPLLKALRAGADGTDYVLVDEPFNRSVRDSYYVANPGLSVNDRSVYGSYVRQLETLGLLQWDLSLPNPQQVGRITDKGRAYLIEHRADGL